MLKIVWFSTCLLYHWEVWALQASKHLMHMLYSKVFNFLNLHNNNTIQYNNNLFAFPFEIRLQEIYIYIYFFFMLRCTCFSIKCFKVELTVKSYLQHMIGFNFWKHCPVKYYLLILLSNLCLCFKTGNCIDGK